MDDKVLKELHDKVDDHDRSLTIISKAVEDINKNLSRFADSNEKLAKDMVSHWHMQDRTMDKLEIILEKQANSEERFREIRDTQNGGCTYVKNFEKIREAQLKHYDSILENLITASKKNREEIDIIENKIITHDTSFIGSNARLKKIEFWQDNVMKFLVTKSLVVIGILIATIWGMMN